MDYLKQAESIYNVCRHYSPSNPIWDGRWAYIEPSTDKPCEVTHKVHTLNKIVELLKQGYKVKYGWRGSSMLNLFLK